MSLHLPVRIIGTQRNLVTQTLLLLQKHHDMEIALAIFHTGNTCICVSGFGPKNRDKIVGFPQLTDIDHQFKNVHKLIFLFVCCLVGMYAVSVRVLRRVVLRGTGHCEREKQS